MTQRCASSIALRGSPQQRKIQLRLLHIAGLCGNRVRAWVYACGAPAHNCGRRGGRRKSSCLVWARSRKGKHTEGMCVSGAGSHVCCACCPVAVYYNLTVQGSITPFCANARCKHAYLLCLLFLRLHCLVSAVPVLPRQVSALVKMWLVLHALHLTGFLNEMKNM